MFQSSHVLRREPAGYSDDHALACDYGSDTGHCTGASKHLAVLAVRGFRRFHAFTIAAVWKAAANVAKLTKYCDLRRNRP